MRKRAWWVLAAGMMAGAGCSRCQPGGRDAGAPEGAPSWNSAVVSNLTPSPVTAYISFGADSVVRSFPFCGDSGGCSFPLAPGSSQPLPTGGAYLNATISFQAAPGCNVSLGEINLGNPSWTEDTANISLVNGWNDDIEIAVTSSDGGVLLLGPTLGPTGNASVFGVYPNGCDICVARQSPPCGIVPCSGPSCGCKAGTQYNPAVPCQASFGRAGAVVKVALVDRDAGVPAK
jgi:hypothetical protein